MSAIDPDLQLHLRRSKCIDAFAAIELEIAVIMTRLNLGNEAEPLGSRIKRIKAMPADPCFSKKQRATVHEILAELEALVPLRHDIVHGGLSVLRAADVTVAAFVNVREATKVGSMARLFTSSSLEQLAADAMKIAAKLRAAMAQVPKPIPKPASMPVAPTIAPALTAEAAA